MQSHFKLVKIAIHLCIGLFIITFYLPSRNKSERASIIRKWSAKLTSILNVKVIATGHIPPQMPNNQMFMSNHISWLDIFALNSIFNSRFVAKSDIQKWPIINRLCSAAGTFFIQREKIKDTKRVNDSITNSLQDGDAITFFPEGTTSDGTHLKPLKTSLVQSVISSQGHVQAIYLNYVGKDGKQSAAAAYIDEMSFLDSIKNLIKAESLEIHIHFLPLINTKEHDRSSISSAIKAQLHEAHLQFSKEWLDIGVKHSQKNTANPLAESQ